MQYHRLLILCLVFPLTACLQSGQPTGNHEPTGFARPITDADMAQLTPLEQYQVYNKLLSTLYKGMPAAEFFDLRKGLTDPQLAQQGLRIHQLKEKLHKSVVDDTYYANLVQTKHDVSLNMENPRTPAYALSMMHEMPLTRTYYYHWIAYQLTNNIMFSPGLELTPVVSTVDAQTIYQRLVRGMQENRSIRDMLYEHLISQENWRRFRSPEDNTREMMEIYLVRFDDSEVPKAATACKNWYLHVNQSYTLQFDGAEPNTVPQYGLLDRDDIISCEDFYHAIAGHPSLIPSMTSRLIDHFFYGYSAEFKEKFINSVMTANPKHFDQLFDAIVFSYEYLTKVTRKHSYEEAFLSSAARLEWSANRRFFHGKVTTDAGTSYATLTNMSQQTMQYKLGRHWNIPFDSLSLANFHKAMRDDLFHRSGGRWPDTLFNAPEVQNLSESDYIHYLFLNALARKATDQEMTFFTNLFTQNGTAAREKAYIVFDYASRLAETYHMPAFMESEDHES